ncbi:8-amino-7-oxononanoate synthase [Fulvivirga imtechensis AK7]|uniref:8-amino-7-oxononanoate synthase n=1 Tax=Fulvivirga imtechensis AK7 TaxID=1237149 RepID=L8K0S2_9BACT|nr:8-amino-7-oxononanoate synthase [Fulvivirga imtechensis]ELR73524.1 8-amino-7-oxononanoate synthase [Fulvivirga imtechensis AK7]
MNFKDRLSKQLESRKENQSLRHLTVKPGLIDFTSNDYLGFARSKALKNLIDDKVKELNTNGATGSRLLSGNSAYTEKVEHYLAQIFKSQNSLIFNSGYSANLAVLSSLPQRGDTILYDELSHASIKDGARLSLANRYSFRHNDLDDLESKLKTATGNAFIAVESIYSMDGDACPLEDLVTLSEKYQAQVILDEAHSTGVIGPQGSGLSCELHLQDKISIRVYTFGKAMGIHGAAVACDQLLRDYLVNFARPFIYTTALSPHSITSIEMAFTYLSSHIHLQDQAKDRVKYFNTQFTQYLASRFTRTSLDHPIQTIVIPGNDQAKGIANYLQNKGYDIRAILSPTVKKGEERLRICLHIYNSDDDISGLIHSLAVL